MPKSTWVKLVHFRPKYLVHFARNRQVAYYTKKNVSENLLFKDSYFRLNSINTSNDPKEGKTLLDYLFNIKDEKDKNIKFPSQIEEEFGAFAACFILNNDSLNQFRLYGKTDEKEGTGVSISLNENFFSKKISNCIKMESETKHKNKDDDKSLSPLFRCIYIDPKTGKLISLGQKDESVFYRENKTKNEYNIYKGSIENKQTIISIKLEELKKNIIDLDLAPNIVYHY